MAVDDHSLARAAARGDSDAFGALLERHYDRLFALACRLTGCRAEAEDLTQDICAALPAKLQGFDGRARVGTWLYRVAVNAAHDRRRRSGTRARAAEGWGDWERERRAADAEDQARALWLLSALHRLPEDLRDTLALVLDDLTHAEAGAILGISEGTVSWRVSRAKEALRRLRDEEEAVG